MSPHPRPPGAHARPRARPLLLPGLCTLLLAACVLLAAAATAAPDPAAAPADVAYPRDVVRSPGPLALDPEPRSPSRHLQLLNTALVACTDGSLHGVDRHTGSVRWSLGCGASWPDTSSDATGQQEECLPFRPVVSASYGPDRVSLNQMIARSTQEELSIYLVEPTAQGELYVLSGSPSSLLAHTSMPGHTGTTTSSSSSSSSSTTTTSGESLPATLVKLPLTLPQLVALSPFTFPGDDSRVFVGSKQARLVEVNVRTGAIRSIFGDSSTVANLSEPGGWDWSAAGVSTGADGDVWALIGRTDYTLAIHAKHDPNLSQLLHLSLYSPNLADRDVLAAWNSRDYPDPGRILVLPDEGSLVCLNTSVTPSPSPDPNTENRENQESWQDDEVHPFHRTVWTTEMEASVASVFDFVQPIDEGAAVDGTPENARRPVLVPHPILRLGSLFHFPDHAGLQSEQDVDLGVDTYVGASEGSLYAMSSTRYPLAALGPPAPASHSSECHGMQCMIGSYQSQHPSGGAGSIDPFMAFWFDAPRGIDGPSSAPWDSSRVPTIEPPTVDSATSSSPSSGQHWVEQANNVSYRSVIYGVAGTVALLLFAVLLLGSHFRINKIGTSPATEVVSNSVVKRVQPSKSTLNGISRKNKASSNPKAPQDHFAQSTPNGSHAASDVPVSTRDTPAEATHATPALLQMPPKEASESVATTNQETRSPENASTRSSDSPIRRPPPEWITNWNQNAQQFRAGIAASTAEPDPAAGGESIISSETASEAVFSPLSKPKKKRRGKRAGQQVAAKAARAERIAAAEAEAMAAESVPEEGYFTKPPSTAREVPASVINGTNGTSNIHPEQDSPPDADSSTDSTEAIKTNGSSCTPDSESRPPSSTVAAPGYNAKPTIDRTAPASDETVHSGKTRAVLPPLDLTHVNVRPSEEAHGQGQLALASPQRDMEARRIEEHLFELEGKGQVLHDAAPAARTSSLTISDEILGYGSSGTVVFKGSFQGRAVAVKRLLKDFTRVASKEVHLLESADDHPNVVRYFYQEVTDSFLYIALELCQATLADVVENPGPGPYQDLAALLHPKSALEQIALGLQHLHGLSIVHRDLKPHNILVTVAPPARSTKYVGAANRRPRLKMLLSDFGLSKKLDGVAQSSFSQTVNHPAGTVGWRAPEILRGEVSLESGAESTDVSVELKSSANAVEGRGEERRRLTRAVDVFAYGCIAYYVLSTGQHPFGSRFERELNVLRGAHDLSFLTGLGEEGYEGRHLILGCVCQEPARRPTAAEVLLHPYFWTPHKRLQFLLQSSDAFDTLERDPPAPPLVALERKSNDVLGAPGWTKRVDALFVADLGKFRSYDPHRVQDLLRAMRNKAHHYQDMSPRLQHVLGSLPDGFLMYFTHRFPKLFLHVYSVIASQPFLRSESRFRIFLDGDSNEV